MLLEPDCKLVLFLGQRITNEDIYLVSKYVKNFWYLGRLQILFWCSATEGFPLHSIDHCSINLSRDMTRSDFEDLELSFLHMGQGFPHQLPVLENVILHPPM